MSELLNRLLEEKEVIIADGAMGTSLFRLGLADGTPGEMWNVDRPDAVASVHQGFVDAGSAIILTNTFGANRIRLDAHGLAHRVRELNLAGARTARQVADRSGRPVVVAGDIGPIGQLLEPLGTTSIAAAKEAFLEQAEALREGGVDVFWVETMSANEELDAAVSAILSLGLPYVATMTFDTNGRTMMGVRPDAAIRRARTFQSPPIAFGANCGVGPSQLLDSVIGLVRGAEGETAVVAKGNCGMPVLGPDRKVSYNATPELFAAYGCLARDAGARIIGGCCGTTAEHIKSMAHALATRPRGPGPSYADIEKQLGPLTITTM